METFTIKNKVHSETFPNLIGDSHRYKTSKGEISCVHPCMSTMERYEIYCIEGDLFEGIERYDTLQEAEERIHHLLL